MKTTINGKEKEVEYKDGHYELDGTSFDGHILLWSFSYEPKTYLKESELSGDEWRKGGQVRIFMNGDCVFNQFCRTEDRALWIVAEYLPKLKDCELLYPMGNTDGWKERMIGRKIYHSGVESVIDRYCGDGEIIVRTENGQPYDIYAHKKEAIKNGEDFEDEWGEKDRIHITDSRIYPFRS